MQCVYRGLSRCYADTVKEISAITGKEIIGVNIIGGGCQDAYLNELTARTTGLTVYAGPIEGTAIGNLVVQMIEEGEFDDLQAARDVIFRSFEIKEFKP
jgi:rhamnulokinase